MMEQKINDFIVVPPKPKGGKQQKALGYKLFEEPYPNIFLCAQKKSGKTSVIANILEQCTGPDTHVILFVSTVNKDSAWTDHICPMLDKKEISYEKHEHFIEGGRNLVDDFVQEQQAKAALLKEQEEERKRREEMNKEKKKEKTIVFGGMKWDVDKAPLAAKEEEKEPKKRKEKYLAPEFILVFDDLGKTMRRGNAIAELVKKNRHFKMKVILSGQFILDISPDALRQMDYLLIFGGIPREKLKQLHDKITVICSYETLQKMYDYATQQKYSFLYLQTGTENQEFRRNFNFRLDPTKF